ncbi:MAG: hypothetical protein JRJ77_13245, partial [Deltaproteobacteria bacterium]|nr:hypothetical protein [Deltaproteobacteria bacterium]
RETMILARQLAEAVNLPEAEGAIGELAILEDTSLKKGLIHCLKSSIAFHHADLSSEERNVIETYTRSGEIRVVCCTTTLALGVNLPATTVFLDARKWEYDERTDSLILSPMSWAEYENISGRAGRLGYEMDFGRSITIATSDYEYQMIWQNYIISSISWPQISRKPGRSWRIFFQKLTWVSLKGERLSGRTWKSLSDFLPNINW